MNKAFLTLVVGELMRLRAVGRLAVVWEFCKLDHLLLFQVSVVSLVFLWGICRVVNTKVTITLNGRFLRPWAAHRRNVDSVMGLVYCWVNRLYVISNILAWSNLFAGSLLEHLFCMLMLDKLTLTSKNLGSFPNEVWRFSLALITIEVFCSLLRMSLFRAGLIDTR